jgi:hypothetical protein
MALPDPGEERSPDDGERVIWWFSHGIASSTRVQASSFMETIEALTAMGAVTWTGKQRHLPGA